MIFVTVGTHEQPFNRLIECVDQLKGNGVIADNVMMQIGFSTYKPKFCRYSKLLPYQEMLQYVTDARIIITHGGPASFMMPLQIGKIPIVVPRQFALHEHVNNHQVKFVRNVASRAKNIIAIYDIADLRSAIENYDKIVCTIPSKILSHNNEFNTKFEAVITELFTKKR